ncbi:cytochrome b/b6 domain-containing protein [Variovorax sp. YR216]|uniref:cytochrome b/b6 domain-containing protein n=1 Tax=Variovorax sp. YR216 TaxID=1882828 RepID=UPI000895800B|nr:cytochrome b/b6 domain-containing protein [Variovorax sp. YR216]SEA66141.1 Cytochrome b [Variovorax sp. YR216]
MTASLEPARCRPGPDNAGALPVRVWDLPTRLFHWSLALTVVCSLATGFGGVMEWHFRFGYAALSLLLFRVIWGFIGGRWSRFSAFIYAPRSLLAYLRGQAHPDHLVGHTPLGALSVFALLVVLIAQVSTGLVADDEISASGPLTRFVPAAVVSLASGWHVNFGKWIVIALVSVHILAVLFYVRVKRQQLVRPMIDGDKCVAAEAAASSRDDAGSRALALVVVIICSGFAAWIASLRL